jgi:glutaredoxin 3
MRNITIYSTPTCHFCHLAKDFFTDHNLSFTDKDAASDPAIRKEAIEKSGQMGVPVIDIDGEIIIGFDEPKIKALLGL